MIRGPSTLRLVVLPGSIRVETTAGAPWQAEASFDSVPELADAIARLAAEAPRNRIRSRVSVLLERPLVQVRALDGLPPVRPQDLAALVASQTGRFFRRNGHPLATDAQWQGRGGVARAAAAEEPLLDAIAMGARAAGLRLETIAPVDAPELCLLPGGERAERRRAARTLLRRLAVGAAAAWAAAGLLFTARLFLERRAVERELRALQAPLAAELAARHELRSAELTVLTMRDAQRDGGVAGRAFARVAAALPDSSVLGAFAWNADGSGALSGWAKDASAVVAALARSQAVPQPRLEGPAVKETVAGREWQRFTVVFGPGTP